MALSIKNRAVEEKARKLARLTGKPITEALNDALDQSLLRPERIAKLVPKEDLWTRIQIIQREISEMPDREPRLTDDEVLGYDEYGIPTQ